MRKSPVSTTSIASPGSPCANTVSPAASRRRRAIAASSARSLSPSAPRIDPPGSAFSSSAACFIANPPHRRPH